MCSPRVGRPMAATAPIRSVCRLLPVPGRHQTLAAGSAELYLDSLRASASIRAFMTCASSKTTGVAHTRSLGLGWEVWLNGMEITQFTYFQQWADSTVAP